MAPKIPAIRATKEATSTNNPLLIPLINPNNKRAAITISKAFINVVFVKIHETLRIFAFKQEF